MVHIACLDSSYMRDLGRMEINYGLVLEAVAGLANTLSWGPWSQSCVVAWPTMASGPRRWQFLQ